MRIDSSSTLVKGAIEVPPRLGSGLRLGLQDSDLRLGAGDKVALVIAIAEGCEIPVPLHPPAGGS